MERQAGHGEQIVSLDLRIFTFSLKISLPQYFAFKWCIQILIVCRQDQILDKIVYLIKIKTVHKGTYVVTPEVRMGMINTVIKNANDDALSCNSFTPNWNDVYVITDRASCLTKVFLNTQQNTASLSVALWPVLSGSAFWCSVHFWHIPKQVPVLNCSWWWSNHLFVMWPAVNGCAEFQLFQSAVNPLFEYSGRPQTIPTIQATHFLFLLTVVSYSLYTHHTYILSVFYDTVRIILCAYRCHL